MKYLQMIGISLVLLLLLVQSFQPVHSESILKPLYDKLHEELSGGKFGDYDPRQRVVLLAGGGWVLDPTANVVDHRGKATLIKALADIRLPRGTYVVPTPGTMSELYGEFVATAVPARAASALERLQEENEQLKLKLEKVTLEQQGLLVRHNDAAAHLLAAGEQCASALSTYAKDHPQSRARCEAWRHAKSVLESDPDMLRVKKYFVEVKRAAANDVGFWLANLGEEVEKHRVLSGAYTRATFFPEYSEWFKDGVGVRIAIDTQVLIRDVQIPDDGSYLGSAPRTLRRGWPVECSDGSVRSSFYDCPPADVSLGPEKSTRYSDRPDVTIRRETIHLSFDLVSIKVEFPWLKTEFFRSAGWVWRSNYKYASCCVISYGSVLARPTTAKEELLPLIPVALLVARNFRMKAASSEALQRFLRNDSVEQSAGGPFRFKGKDIFGNKVIDVAEISSSATVSFDLPQVIGYVASETPASPRTQSADGSGPRDTIDGMSIGVEGFVPRIKNPKVLRLWQETLEVLGQ